MAPGEGAREQDLRIALSHDPRFDPLQIDSDIPVDVQFAVGAMKKLHRIGNSEPEYVPVAGNKIFNCELKQCSDYISSALGKDGHLYCQHLSMRESGHPAMILVLGSDLDVSNAIIDSLQTRYRGKELAFQISNYEARLQDYESKSFALGIPIMRWKNSPFKRLLSTAYKVLTESNLMDYSPRPIDNEREIVASSILYRGIGPDTMKNLLVDYDLCFVPKPGARDVEDIPGFGPKRAALVKSRIVESLK
jgi:hypothetical protein